MSEPYLALLHTGEVHVAGFTERFQEAAPDISLRHLVRADLLAAAEAAGGLTPEIAADTATALNAALAEGATCVLCTCSTLGPAVEAAAQEAAAPILRIDRAMAEKAIAESNRVLVVAAVETTIGPTLALLEEVAATAGHDVTFRTLVLPEAWALFQVGDQAGYTTAIADAIREKLGDADMVVLAQASMAGAVAELDDLGVPVLASPPLAVAQAIQLFRERAASA